MAYRMSYLLLAVFFLMITGCSLEQKLAKTFIEEARPKQFFLLKPSYVFKSNLKEFEIPGIDTLDDLTRDSLLMDHSLFLKLISDSVLIEEFTDSFKRTLESYGTEVFPEDAVDTIMENGGTPYIVNIAQLSLEEYVHPYSSEEMVYDDVVVIDGIDLNAINYNLWLELGRMNTEKSNKVLFASDYLLDDLNGNLKQNLLSGKITFDYTIDTITTYRVYEFARRFGRVTASYLFDYLMNYYIEENLPLDYPYEKLHYHYDPARKIVYIINPDEGFIELENQ
jgi:hypothetical protein